MTAAISREDVIAWLEHGRRFWIGEPQAELFDVAISYLRPLPADDGVIGRVERSLDEGTELSRIDARVLIALARQAGATGEHPVSVGAACPDGWKLVPREPDRAMWANMGNAALDTRDYSHDTVSEAVWTAGYDAAPPPPVQLSGNPGELPAPPPIPASVLAEAFSDVGPRGQKWCQPGDRPNRQWMLIFDDPDRGRMFWDDEDTELQAREAFAKVWPSWSCTLFCAAPWSPAPPSDAVAELVAAAKRAHEVMRSVAAARSRIGPIATKAQQVGHELGAAVAKLEGK